MQVRSGSKRVRTYQRGYLTFYVTDTNKIYFATKLQKFIIVHIDGKFYKDDRDLVEMAHSIRYGTIKDLNSLAGSCRRHGVIWQAVNKLPQ